MSKKGEIRRDEGCLDYGGLEVIVYPCHGDKVSQKVKMFFFKILRLKIKSASSSL